MKKETRSYLVLNTDDRDYAEKLPFLRREERREDERLKP